MRVTTLRRVAFVGNYPPRCCGIATFTADLAVAIAGARPALKWDVVAINDRAEGHSYPPAVTRQIAQDSDEDYLAAARSLNAANIDAVSLQHEFGIFGGPAGERILAFCRALRCPIVTTLHTVLERPNSDQRRVIEELIALSAKVIVMTERSKQIMLRAFAVPVGKLLVIPHGAPDRPQGDSATLKARLGFADRAVALTFGLLSPNKGIESVIRALPAIIARQPNALYVVLGATHPHLVARQGESYRQSLHALAAELGVSAHVRFVDQFVDIELLLDYLSAADVYVTPYLNEAQATSGTLAYALALGKPVVSTPYWHAKEALANEVGVLVDFGASDQFAQAIGHLLENDEARRALAKRAHRQSRPSVWAAVGERYVEVIEKAVAQRNIVRKPVRKPLPPVSVRALERMSDACGILQHGRFGVADRLHGYCLDDNARALIATQRIAALGAAGPVLDRLTPAYAAFMEHAWNEGAQRFRNFMTYDRSWLEEAGSDDSFGRALWALGETVRVGKDRELRRWALHLAHRAAPALEELQSLRAHAFGAIGLSALVDAGEASLRTALRAAANMVLEGHGRYRRDDWRWFEPALAYDNARLPEALIRAGRTLSAPHLVQAGLESLAWLMHMQTGAEGRFRPVGTETFARPHTPPTQFDQQPVEVAATVDACWAAFDVAAEPCWSFEAERAFAWFFGANDLGVEMALADTGGCYDGLMREGPNRNQGAESILSYLMALAAMRARGRLVEAAVG